MFALTQGLRRAVQTKPNGISTQFASRRRTWQQTSDRVSRIAGALFALGVRPGDRVAILALNSDRYFELMYAIPWIGAVMVPINTRLAAPEIEYILSDSGAVALFIDTAMSHHLTPLEDKMPGVREVVWLDDTSGPEGLLHFEDHGCLGLAQAVGRLLGLSLGGAAEFQRPGTGHPGRRLGLPGGV
jgi:long-chain acyl-CoA synthetase